MTTALFWAEELARDGVAILPAVFDTQRTLEIRNRLEAALGAIDSTMRSQAGSIYGARNVLDAWPPARHVWHQAPLPEVLESVLGSRFGLVRALWFDKPPDHTWALPWHKDLTIAVRAHRPSTQLTKPTTKAGVPHVEASRSVLEAMLTARIHLDDVTEENGPLKVIPGSHRSGKTMVLGDVPPRSILVAAGDVLLMRPLVAHSSGHSVAGTTRHRRILHLEFAASPELPDGHAWHDFIMG